MTTTTTTTATTNSPLSTTTTDHQESTVTPTYIVEQCSSCKSTKTRPHYFLDNQENVNDNDDQPLSKKPNLSHLATQFTNIHISAPPSLRRTFSAPLSPPVHPTSLNPFVSTPKNDNKNAQALLKRCVSDPTPAFGIPVSSPESNIGNSAVNETPEKKTASLPPRQNPMLRRRRRIEAERMRRKREGASSEEKVKKMKEIIGVTCKWLSRIAQEDEEKQQEQEGSQDTHVAQYPKEEEEDVGGKCDPETEEEAVTVEKTEECLMMQFKCNCSKTYQILLHGDACYYKLM